MKKRRTLPDFLMKANKEEKVIEAEPEYDEYKLSSCASIIFPYIVLEGKRYYLH